MIVGWGIAGEIAQRWMSLDLTDDKSALVQIMAWCRQATSHYLSQCWPRPMSPYGVTRPEWVNHWGWVTHICDSKQECHQLTLLLVACLVQAIIWTNAGLLLIEPSRINLREIPIKIKTFSCKKICLKMSSIKWLSFCPGLNVLIHWGLVTPFGDIDLGCSCTWQRSLSCETNTGAIEKIQALNQGWRGCNHPTSSWPYQGHQVPYLVPRTTKCLSPLWSNTDHWPYASGVCSVTGMSWWILHSWLIEYSLRDNSRDLHSGIPTRSGILLSDMNGQTFYTITHLNHPRQSNAVC